MLYVPLSKFGVLPAWCRRPSTLRNGARVVDNIVIITFNEVDVKTSTGSNSARISGTIEIDYTTGRVLNADILAPPNGGTNYHFKQFQFVTPPAGSDFALSSPSNDNKGTLTFSYSGTQPAALNSVDLHINSIGDFTTFRTGSSGEPLNELSDQALTPNDLTYAGTASGFNHFIDLYNFEASYPDLIAAFGLNQQAMQTWYNTSEPTEQRIETFDGLEYVASYKDLIKAFAADGTGGNLQALLDDGAKHYINNGLSEGRATTFNGLDYIASNSDLIAAFGANSDLGAYHWIEYGLAEGRPTNFDGLDYIASYPDLIAAFGANEQAGAAHYITSGVHENRTTSFDGLSYIADHTDLMNAFGANNDAGASHYITHGFNEDRSNEFTFNNQVGAAAVHAYETQFPTTAHFGVTDAFFIAYIDTYKSTGKFLGQG
jgi:hypothetical protein